MEIEDETIADGLHHNDADQGGNGVLAVFTNDHEYAGAGHG